MIFISLFFLLIWFLLSIICQFKTKLSGNIRKYDIFKIIPLWTFFTPNPATIDYEILYRDKDINSNISEWYKVIDGKNLSWFCFLYNPRKFEIKIVADLIAQILYLLKEDFGPQILRITYPYLAILNHVTSLEKTSNINQRQFVIIEKNNLNNLKTNLILLSEWHNL